MKQVVSEQLKIAREEAADARESFRCVCGMCEKRFALVGTTAARRRAAQVTASHHRLVVGRRPSRVDTGHAVAQGDVEPLREQRLQLRVKLLEPQDPLDRR